MSEAERREGRLHYYAGHFVETTPDEPWDMAAIDLMETASGRGFEELLSDTHLPEYAMADYVAEAGIAKIALKPQDFGPGVLEAAKRRFEEWAGGRGLEPEFVPYDEI